MRELWSGKRLILPLVPALSQLELIDLVAPIFFSSSFKAYVDKGLPVPLVAGDLRGSIYSVFEHRDG